MVQLRHQLQFSGTAKAFLLQRRQVLAARFPAGWLPNVQWLARRPSSPNAPAYEQVHAWPRGLAILGPGSNVKRPDASGAGTCTRLCMCAASQGQELASTLDLHRVGLPNSRARERFHQPQVTPGVKHWGRNQPGEGETPFCIWHLLRCRSGLAGNATCG